VSELMVCRLGTVEYRAAAALQSELRTQVQEGALEDVLLLLDHPPVYTLGRRSQPGELPRGEDWYRSQGIDVVRTDRGGKLTYHGPGQLVGYPIMRVSDVPAYVGLLEEALVAALVRVGIAAHVRHGRDFHGVWVEDRKIASIGLHVSRGVSMHGFAVNVDNDLRPFEWVVACGLPDVRMTSVRAETGRGGSFEGFAEIATEALCTAFARTRRDVAPDSIGAVATPV
jgi:lipoyl(octanoyl) transferase